MAEQHSRATIVSMAVIASAAATLLHEGVGHGVTAWLRGDTVTALTSNHLSAEPMDRWVEAGGTLVNLAAGALALTASRAAGRRASTRYFLWLLAALNLLPGAGYFLFSGVFGFGDWFEVIRGLPHEVVLRVGMTLFGAMLYVGVVKMLAVAVRPFVGNPRVYNTVGRLPYYAACAFSCVAGAFDPLGWRLLVMSTIPAAFGGSSGLMWADSLMPKNAGEEELRVGRSRGWWVAAVVIGVGYVVVLGRGIKFGQ